MKKILITVFSALLCLQVFAAPTGTITGRVTDLADSTDIAGAVVEYAPVKNPEQKRHATSSAGGWITIQGLSYGEYTLKISFLGYSDLTRSVKVNAPTVNLGRIGMTQQAKGLGEVVKTTQAIRTSQRGDTVIYNADAFKVASDATAEGLLAKLPGIRIVDGTVEAQGETVQKVLVDGKEFFGEDVNSAIKNLPAEAIAKIEVFNKQSDQAELTGINDGQDFKAINIVTRPEMRQGQFGKLYAGYGFSDKYIVGGNVNVFSGNNRWSFIGLSNNMNQQNFSMEDILGVTGGGGGGGSRFSRGGGSRGGGSGSRGGGGSTRGFMVPQQSGISGVNSFGVNYSGQWGKKVTFSGNYFFNTSDNENESRTVREYLTGRLYESESRSGSTNYNNRFNARMEYKINDNHSIMYRPSVSFQNYSSHSEGTELNGQRIFEDGSAIRTDSLTTAERHGRSDADGYDISNFLLYRAKLGKPGRTLSVEGNINFSNNDNDSYSYSTTRYLEDQRDSVSNKHTLSKSEQMRLRASLMYTEPLSEKMQINAQYRFSYNDQPANRRVYSNDPDNPDDPERFMPDIDPRLSDIYNSKYTTHSFGPGFNYGSQTTVLVFNVSYQTSSLDVDRSYPTDAAFRKSRNFEDVVYFGMLNQTFSPNNTLRVFMRSATDNPSVSQLQDYPDVSDIQNVTSGNSKLQPSYEHSVYLNYNRSMVTKGQTFMAMLGGSFRNRYIGDSLVQLRGDQTYELPNGDILGGGGQYTRKVNLDGYRSVRGMVSFGSPLPWIKCNFNVNAGIDYGRTPSYVNGRENISNTFNYNGGLVLSSNISQNLDFTLRYMAGYNTVSNTLKDRSDENFLNQRIDGNVKWIFWKGITLAASTSYTKYSSAVDDYREEFCIVNVLVGKKVFRNQRGEINVGVNDLLNQNRSYSRTLHDNYIQDSYNKAMGRYVGINFIYNLRNFGKRKSSREGAPEETNSAPPRERIMMGPPPGGGYRGPGGPGGGAFLY